MFNTIKITNPNTFFIQNKAFVVFNAIRISFSSVKRYQNNKYKHFFIKNEAFVVFNSIPISFSCF